MRKKNICICTSQVPFVRGGAELLVESLQRELMSRNYNVELIKIPFKWYPREQIVNSMFNWNLLDLSSSNNQEIDLVIATKFPSYLVQHDNKVVWLMHQFRQVYDQYGTKYSDFTDSDVEIRDLIKREDENGLKNARKLYSIADNVSNRLLQHNNLIAETLYHPPMHYGKYSCSEYGDFILSVGRLEDVKRVDLLIKSVKYTGSDVRIVIAGTGPCEKDLKNLAEQEGVLDRVSFLGFVSDAKLLELYASCRAVYFAPFDEDYGYITLEAFLSHKPVITTKDAGGVLEFVEDKVNGYISDSSPEGIAESMNHLFRNSRLSQDMGTCGFDKVKDITWDNTIDKLTESIQ